MAYGYRYRRRSYRRGYRRYRRYGTSLRRYRSVQMNDNETKIMTFSCVQGVAFNLPAGNSSAEADLTPIALLNAPLQVNQNVDSRAGRFYFAGMLFDRMRFRSLSVAIRPNTMPSGAGVANYNLYAAWDRYGGVSSLGDSYSIQTDPSAKQVTWTPGGSGGPLRSYIYSTFRDKFQYFPINHLTTGQWNIGATSNGQVSTNAGASPFYPHLLLSMVVGTRDTDLTVSVTIHIRATVEFQGGYSSASLNVTSAGVQSTLNAQTLNSLPSGSVYELRRFVNNQAQNEEDVDTLTDRIQKFQLENPE